MTFLSFCHNSQPICFCCNGFCLKTVCLKTVLFFCNGFHMCLKTACAADFLGPSKQSFRISGGKTRGLYTGIIGIVCCLFCYFLIWEMEGVSQIHSISMHEAIFGQMGVKTCRMQSKLCLRKQVGFHRAIFE